MSSSLLEGFNKISSTFGVLILCQGQLDLHNKMLMYILVESLYR